MFDAYEREYRPDNQAREISNRAGMRAEMALHKLLESLEEFKSAVHIQESIDFEYGLGPADAGRTSILLSVGECEF